MTWAAASEAVAASTIATTHGIQEPGGDHAASEIRKPGPEAPIDHARAFRYQAATWTAAAMATAPSTVARTVLSESSSAWRRRTSPATSGRRTKAGSRWRAWTGKPVGR